MYSYERTNLNILGLLKLNLTYPILNICHVIKSVLYYVRQHYCAMAVSHGGRRNIKIFTNRDLDKYLIFLSLLGTFCFLFI